MAVYSYNPDRRGLSEVKLLNLEPWRQYPGGDALNLDFLGLQPPTGPRITRSTRIASIGSCFAREIKRWLIANEYAFIETATGPCTAAGSARYDRVYNTFTLRQEFERAFGTFDPIEDVWVFDERGATRRLDPYRKNVAWESQEEMAAELATHRDNVRHAFSSADVLIITVGQAEIWYHKGDGSVYPLVPPVQVFDPDQHGFRLSTYDENLANLERVFELFTANNTNGHVLITVSPVPLRATFRRTNSVIANSASKSMLRAMVDEFQRRHPDRVTYFPAYEIVTTVEKQPFEDDNRHVRDETVARIMQVFEAWFVQPDDSDAASCSVPPPQATA